MDKSTEKRLKIQMGIDIPYSEIQQLRSKVAELEDKLESVSVQSYLANSDLATVNQDWHNLNTENNTLSLQVTQFKAEQFKDKNYISDVEVANEALSLQVAQLREALEEAADDISDWGAYASEYFQTKHDLVGCVEKYRAIAHNTAPSQNEWIKRSENKLLEEDTKRYQWLKELATTTQTVMTLAVSEYDPVSIYGNTCYDLDNAIENEVGE